MKHPPRFHSWDWTSVNSASSHHSLLQTWPGKPCCELRDRPGSVPLSFVILLRTRTASSSHPNPEQRKVSNNILWGPKGLLNSSLPYEPAPEKPEGSVLPGMFWLPLSPENAHRLLCWKIESFCLLHCSPRTSLRVLPPQKALSFLLAGSFRYFQW